jgi:hypothetical protein
MIEGEDSTERRGLLLAWLEEAHLKKKLFLSVDEKGGLIAVSWMRFKEMYQTRSRVKLTKDEKEVLTSIGGPMTTPELRKASGMQKGRFERALSGLRSKMRITLVDVKKESRTKHVNCYDMTENW